MSETTTTSNGPSGIVLGKDAASTVTPGKRASRCRARVAADRRDLDRNDLPCVRSDQLGEGSLATADLENASERPWPADRKGSLVLLALVRVAVKAHTDQTSASKRSQNSTSYVADARITLGTSGRGDPRDNPGSCPRWSAERTQSPTFASRLRGSR